MKFLPSILGVLVFGLSWLSYIPEVEWPTSFAEADRDIEELMRSGVPMPVVTATAILYLLVSDLALRYSQSCHATAFSRIAGWPHLVAAMILSLSISFHQIQNADHINTKYDIYYNYGWVWTRLFLFNHHMISIGSSILVLSCAGAFSADDYTHRASTTEPSSVIRRAAWGWTDASKRNVALRRVFSAFVVAVAAGIGQQLGGWIAAAVIGAIGTLLTTTPANKNDSA